MTIISSHIPERIEDEAHLEQVLAMPTPELIYDLAQVEGDILSLIHISEPTRPY